MPPKSANKAPKQAAPAAEPQVQAQRIPLPRRLRLSTAAFCLSFGLQLPVLYLVYGPRPSVQRTSADRPESVWISQLRWTEDPTVTAVSMVAAAYAFTTSYGIDLGEAMKWKHPRKFQDGSISIAIGTLAFVLVTYCLGAPLNPRSLLLSAQLAILTVYPAVLVYGLPALDKDGFSARYRLTRMFCEFRAETPSEKDIVNPYIGALVGAWLGVFTLALDWDRPWQAFPLPPAAGAVLGHIVGSWL